jgi:hypothetical protein
MFSSKDNKPPSKGSVKVDAVKPVKEEVIAEAVAVVAKATEEVASIAAPVSEPVVTSAPVVTPVPVTSAPAVAAPIAEAVPIVKVDEEDEVRPAIATKASAKATPVIAKAAPVVEKNAIPVAEKAAPITAKAAPKVAPKPIAKVAPKPVEAIITELDTEKFAKNLITSKKAEFENPDAVILKDAPVGAAKEAGIDPTDILRAQQAVSKSFISFLGVDVSHTLLRHTAILYCSLS